MSSARFKILDDVAPGTSGSPTKTAKFSPVSDQPINIEVNFDTKDASSTEVKVRCLYSGDVDADPATATSWQVLQQQQQNFAGGEIDTADGVIAHTIDTTHKRCSFQFPGNRGKAYYLEIWVDTVGTSKITAWINQQ